MLIGELARRTRCTVQTVRYYETQGLLPAPERSRGNQRVYGAAHERRLGFIRHARELGFALDDIRTMVSLAEQGGRSCAEIDAIAQGHLAETIMRIERLTALKSELERMIGACRGGTAADCPIVEVLADYAHGHCQFHDKHVEQ